MLTQRISIGNYGNFFIQSAEKHQSDKLEENCKWLNVQNVKLKFQSQKNMENGRPTRQSWKTYATRNWPLRMPKMRQRIPRSTKQKENLN
jgi:hypothetical protein